MASSPSRTEYKTVVAIDFGTTYTGFAFSKYHEDGNQNVYSNKEWGSAQGFRAIKAPTCILLNPQKEFEAFGFEAAEKYAQMQNSDEAKKFYFFDRFKMMLHDKEVSRI